MPDFKYVNLGNEGDIVSVVLSGTLDAMGCDYLLQCVEGLIEEGHTKLILDCEELTYISSVGLGMLVRVHSRMKKKRGDVKLAGVHGAVAQVIGLVHLDKVLQIYPTVKEAVAAHGN